MALFDFLKKKDDMGDLGDLGKDLGGENFGADTGPEPAFPDESSQNAFGGRGAQQPLFGQQQQGFGQPQQAFMPPPPAPSYPQYSQDTSKELIKAQIDVISTKMDGLKASIDRLSEKIEFIERYLIRR